MGAGGAPQSSLLVKEKLRLILEGVVRFPTVYCRISAEAVGAVFCWVEVSGLLLWGQAESSLPL